MMAMNGVTMAPFERDDDAAVDLLTMDDFLRASSSSDLAIAPSNMVLDPAVSDSAMHALLLDDDADAFMDAFAPAMDGVVAVDERIFDGSYSPTTTDDTDVASNVSTPPPTSAVDEDMLFHEPTPTPASPALSTRSNTTSSAIAPASPSPSVIIKSSPNSSPAAPKAPTANAMPIVPVAPPFTPPAMLPFAFPVACFPQLNLNQKRPLPEVLPTATSAIDASLAKKSKREIRQMKNRESANRSRLRRKAQLSEMSFEVEQLTNKQHELENTIAALRAENKSLHDQNTFLRSLVTMYSDPSRMVQLPPVPHQASSSVSLSDLENGQAADDTTAAPSAKRKKTVGSTTAKFSAASLGLCASVFGLTIFTDVNTGGTSQGNVRRTGRMLHSLPSSTNPSCSPTSIYSTFEWFWHNVSSGWTSFTESDLAFGVFLNVISFVVILALYHVYQRHFSSHPKKNTKRAFHWEPVSTRVADVPDRRSPSGTPRRHAKRRSTSWQDVRIRDGATSGIRNLGATPPPHASNALPRVRVFT
ncbi:hypothetical protein PINS_up007135 [Pythium insidiosum]|nr:hypothetical protein PINS_up007135 [Pythium insidiosum]